MKKYIEFEEDAFIRARNVLDEAGIAYKEAIVAGRFLGEKNVIERILFEIGVHSHTKGFSYIKEVLELSMIEPGTLTKEVYPLVAKRFGTSQSNVEKAIRFAIKGAWQEGFPEEYRRLFQHSEKKPPSNGVFLRRMIEVVETLGLQETVDRGE